MFLPLYTDRRMKHTPWVNYTLIAVNVAVYLWMTSNFETNYPRTFPYQLTPWHLEWYQFFTYQFLHSGWKHLLGNIYFLYAFGNALEDRLGPVGYLGFYLAGGVIAGLGHSLIDPDTVVGASGAISAVTGAYLALFPVSQVTIGFFWIPLFAIPSMYLILFSFGLDLFNSLVGSGGVAYLAHVSGNVYGFAVGMALLWVRLLPREPFDFLALLDRWNRRRQFRAATRQGAAPWRSQAKRQVASEEEEDHPHRAQVMELRSSIAGHLSAGRQPFAMDDFEKLATIDPQAVLARQSQLDLANYAMQHERHELAAHAYEGFLRVYSTDEYRSQVELILGLIYARYVRRPERAAELLRAAMDKIDDESQKKMAGEILSQLDE